ncbi:MAG: homoserine O-succinyltransferase MetA [Acetobacteraceae bacterium]
MPLVPTETRSYGERRRLPSLSVESPASQAVDGEAIHDSVLAPIELGFVNNMPDAALEATERQFLNLIEAGAGRLDVRVHFFALADVPRGEQAERHLSLCYDDLNALVQSRLDAVIITGNEPKAVRLSDEPYWGSLTRLFDWAESSTLSALFSCLGAHAAALHFDDIERTRLTRKCSGVFDHANSDHHPLTIGLGNRWPVAHSRWNGIPEDVLRAAGYTVLSRSEKAGVNLFVRQGRSLLVLLQGHPEYDADSLFREYRRDVRRCLAGEQSYWPAIPEGCFEAATASLLQDFRATALARRDPATMAGFPERAGIDRARLARARCGAARLFGNWLRTIAEIKEHASAATRPLQERPAGTE